MLRQSPTFESPMLFLSLSLSFSFPLGDGKRSSQDRRDGKEREGERERETPVASSPKSGSFFPRNFWIGVKLCSFVCRHGSRVRVCWLGTASYAQLTGPFILCFGPVRCRTCRSLSLELRYLFPAMF